MLFQICYTVALGSILMEAEWKVRNSIKTKSVMGLRDGWKQRFALLLLIITVSLILHFGDSLSEVFIILLGLVTNVVFICILARAQALETNLKTTSSS